MKARTVIAIILAYLVPGAGHLYLGRRGRAIAFFAIVVIMFLIGISIDGELYTFARASGSALRILAAIGTAGAGVLYFIALMAGVHGDVTSITYEHGTAFAITAGLMNLLLMLDVFDIAEGRKE
jgi:TM2 domain-containing membrane protein YozV